jgi:hypothetical protein
LVDALAWMAVFSSIEMTIALAEADRGVARESKRHVQEPLGEQALR